MDRRRLLQAFGATLLAAGGISSGRAATAAPPTPTWLAAVADGAGRYHVAGLTGQGRRAFETALPGRGHGATRHPHQPLGVVFARRPGTFALVVDLATGTVAHRIDSPAGRHFYGHGVFSADGRQLFTAENDFGRGVGVIGVHDATDGYRRLGEMPSHGIGPHDLHLLADGATLVVANGGILTHPDYGRAKLNIPTMQPSLAYVDVADGSLRDAFRLAPELNRLSIRHLAVAPDDTVVIAMQWQGPQDRTMPIAARHRGEAGLSLLPAPDALARRMQNYGGSAAVDVTGAIAAVSAPRGNLIAFWDLEDGTPIGHAEVPDGCGVAPTGRSGELCLSSGVAGLYLWDEASGRQRRLASAYADARHWDNHLVYVGRR